MLSRKLTVEFIGTFFLMFTVGMAVARAGSLAPLAIGAVLMVMVFAGGHISGAHYNPAVSTAVLARGGMAKREFLPYVVTQSVAAILGGLLIRALGYAPHAAIAVAGTGTMLVVEFLFTFALAYVVLNVATASDTENNSFYGLAIGSTLAVGAFAAGSITGGVFNPAVALGASVLGMLTWSHIWIYVLAELAGGAVAAGVFLFTQAGEPVSAARPDAA
jgi:aquaporin Z